MKRLITAALLLCIMLSLCACNKASSSLPEDKLFEVIKLGDPTSVAIDVYGAPTDTAGASEEYKSSYIFNPIPVFGLSFTPYVFTDRSDAISYYCYTYNAVLRPVKYEDVFQKLISTFRGLYGEPAQSSDERCEWYLENGSVLFLSINLTNGKNAYMIMGLRLQSA